MKTPLFIRPTFFLVFCFFLLSTVSAFSQENFRILPYLQVYETGKVQLTWFSDSPQASRISIKNSSGLELVNKEVVGVEVPEIYYTSQEKSQSITGLAQGSWLKGDKTYRYRIQADLPAGVSVDYTVTLGGANFTSSFKTPVSKSNWDKIRFIALSDSETEPIGRVTNRAWYPGTPLFRPSIAQLWKDKFGTTVEQGFELPNYMLSEKAGYAENLKIVNSRNPDFMLMPGDLVQAGGYQPGWDEFFRHNAGNFDSGLSKYPIIPALGNWEAFGGVNGGFGINEKGDFLPVVGRKRFHAYFQTPTNDPLQKHRQSYYRVDYGPVTILTLDSSNGTPEQQPSDFDGTTKLTGTQFTVPGTDTQENFTQTQYAGYGGTDLSGFGPGTDQYIWLEENLKSASASGQLIFVQYHHIAFSSGERGVPLNHELSIGQVGTPLRVLNPLLEKYGVIAVFSGHDELFERSFVDEDGDGKGIHYYDVGVAGDGMRGEKRDWLKTPLQTLNYNQYRQWTADQSSVENWNTSGAVPLLIDGGKHYGHLEVNLTKVIQNGKPFARIDFSPVYAFPVLDQNYNLQRIERRVYPDESSLMVALNETDFIPAVKDSVSIFLNEQGKAVLTPEDFLEALPDDPFTYTSSKGFDFTCLNIGVNDVVITSKNTLTAQEWTESTKVWVLDTIAPYFDAANATYLFDPVVGKVSISLADFDIVDFKDNCAQNFTFTQSRFEVTCADIYQNPDQPVWEFPVVLTTTDPSGNSYSRTLKVIIGNVIESKKVSITSLDPLTDDGSSTLRLGNELEYEVFVWTRNGEVIQGQTGKEITINSPGQYQAGILLSSGCSVGSKSFNFEDPAFPAEYTDDVNLILDEFGKATLTSEDVFGTTDKVADELILGQTNFDCSNLGTQKVKITLNYFFGNNSYIYEFWINVIVKDNQAPILTTKIPSLAFDLVKGVLELKPEDFVASLTDNCGITDLYLNKTKITCADYDLPIELILTAKDQSGNITSELLMVSVSSFESQKISINPSGNFQAFSGDPVEIKLGEEFGFSLESWLKDGVPIVGEKGKAIVVNQPGTYWARILPDGGCSVLTEKVTITFSDLPYGEVKEIIELPLDESGKASLKPENVFVSWPPADPNLDIKLSQSEFTCSDIGEKQITITIKNQAGQTWEEKTMVKVQDKLKPVLIPKNFNVDFDVTIGTLALKPSDFIAELTDNCGVKEVTINKTTATCEDLGKEIPVAIRAVDASGNVVEAVAILTLNRIETKKVSISGDAEFCEGSKGLLTLNSEAQFEVVRWRRDGVEIEGQSGKTLEIEQGGSYHAVIRYSGGCLSETALFVVERNPLPKGEIEEKGNILTAPAGFTYQWFRNGELISGATSRELTVHQMGEYTVELTSEAGCKAKLKAVEMTISGLGINRVVDAEELKIFPNPASNFLEVEIISDQNTSYSSIRVYGMDGKEVTSSVIISKTGSNSFAFDITKLANATYLIYLEGDNQRTYFGRFSKNE
jgi:3',5'-cyclic AMP phosphodiesterase CpdA